MTNAIELTHPDPVGHAKSLVDLFVIANKFEETSTDFLKQIGQMMQDHRDIFLNDEQIAEVREYGKTQGMIDE